VESPNRPALAIHLHQMRKRSRGFLKQAQL